MAVVCSPVETKARAAVECASDQHAELQAEFYRQVWDPRATAERVRDARADAAASNPVQPGSEPPTFLFLMDGRVIGHVTTIPVRFWNGREEHSAYWFNGLMVLPEFRNGPVGYSVLKEAVKRLPLTGALTVATASRRLFQGLGFADLGALGNYITILRPARVLRQLDIGALGISSANGALAKAVRMAQRIGATAPAGAAASGALALWRATATPSRTLAACSAAEISSVDLEGLWQRVRSTLAGSPARGGDYLSWRYLNDTAYELTGVRENGSLVAAAVVRSPREEGDARLRGIRVATLTDVMFASDRNEAGNAALCAAEAVARRMGADALLCSASHPALITVLRRRAYVGLAGNLHFMLRDPRGSHGLPASLDQWWLTRGDACADQVF